MQLKSCNALEIIEKYPLNPSSYVMYNFLFTSKFLFLSSFFCFDPNQKCFQNVMIVTRGLDFFP